MLLGFGDDHTIDADARYPDAMGRGWPIEQVPDLGQYQAAAGSHRLIQPGRPK